MQRIISLVAFATAMVLASQGAWASVISATSDGYGLDVEVQALALVNLSTGQLPSTDHGVAPAPYSHNDTVLNVNVTSSVPLVAGGAVTAPSVAGSAISNVDGLAGVRFESATGGVNGANIGLNTLPTVGNAINLLGINATLDSAAQVSGDIGSLTATGTTTIQNLSLTIDAIPVDLSSFVGVSVAPNTVVNLVVLGIANASLTLNEQIVAPDMHSITVNAFDLHLNLAGLVTGSVILGHSDASIVATPEPTSAAMLLTLPIVGMLRRKQRV